MKEYLNCNIYITENKIFIKKDNTIIELENNKDTQIKTPTTNIDNLFILSDTKLLIWDKNEKNTIYLGDISNKKNPNWTQVQIGSCYDNSIESIYKDNTNNIFIKINSNQGDKLKVFKNDKFYNINLYYKDRPFDLRFTNNNITVYQNETKIIKIKENLEEECNLYIAFLMHISNFKNKEIYPEFSISEITISNPNLYPITLTEEQFTELETNDLESILLKYNKNLTRADQPSVNIEQNSTENTQDELFMKGLINLNNLNNIDIHQQYKSNNTNQFTNRPSHNLEPLKQGALPADIIAKLKQN